MNELMYVFSPEEAELVEAKLYALLERQVGMYTGGDSSSVREETAQALLRSAWFTLQKSGAPPRELLTADFNELMLKGQRRLSFDKSVAQSLWQTACTEAPELASVSLRDTLRGIGVFFRRYDLRYFARDIPCDIDYQLCLPVPEETPGVDYIAEYLRRLITENRLLRAFDPRREDALLETARPSYQQLLVNLCEPVFANALALTLIGKTPQALSVSKSDREALALLFEPLPKSAAVKLLREGSLELCKLIGLSDPYSEDYFAEIAEGMYPRIETALGHGGLEGVFITII